MNALIIICLMSLLSIGVSAATLVTQNKTDAQIKRMTENAKVMIELLEAKKVKRGA